MLLENMNPVVRFAASVRNGVMDATVKVTDCRIFYIEKGSLDIYIQDQCCHLEKNSLFYCCGGSIYRTTKTTDVQIICINFDLNHQAKVQVQPYPVCPKPDLWDKMPVNFQPVEDSFFLNNFLVVEDASWLMDDIRELVQEHREHDGLRDALCSNLLKGVLLRLHRTGGQKMPQKLAMVQKYIHRHYPEHITNQDLAQLAGYHEYYLNRIFRSYTGLNLHEYLIKVRMEQAVYLILNTDLPLTAIAEQVGIFSYPHFSGCFKDYFGCAPSQYGNP